MRNLSLTLLHPPSPISVATNVPPSTYHFIASLQSREAFEYDLTTNMNWIKIPYKGNRFILMDGELPHLSTPITALPPDQRRVILGFNFFAHDVGPHVARAPEHSDVFNRTVKLYQVRVNRRLASTRPIL